MGFFIQLLIIGLILWLIDKTIHPDMWFWIAITVIMIMCIILDGIIEILKED